MPMPMTERDLQAIEAQIDSTIPYYVPTLIYHLRKARSRYPADNPLQRSLALLTDAISAIEVMEEEDPSMANRRRVVEAVLDELVNIADAARQERPDPHAK